MDGTPTGQRGLPGGPQLLAAGARFVHRAAGEEAGTLIHQEGEGSWSDPCASTLVSEGPRAVALISDFPGKHSLTWTSGSAPVWPSPGHLVCRWTPCVSGAQECRAWGRGLSGPASAPDPVRALPSRASGQEVWSACAAVSPVAPGPLRGSGSTQCWFGTSGWERCRAPRCPASYQGSGRILAFSSFWGQLCSTARGPASVSEAPAPRLPISLSPLWSNHLFHCRVRTSCLIRARQSHPGPSLTSRACT